MKIDTTKISGYAEMTAEQKIAALEAYEYEDNKNLLSQRNAEIAKKKTEIEELNKKIAEKMTADERAAAEKAALDKERDEEIKALRRENAINRNTAKYAAMGYDAKLAEETATALVDNDIDKVFANQAIFNASMKASIEADALRGTKPPAGKQTDNEAPDFDKMTDAEYFKFMNERKKHA